MYSSKDSAAEFDDLKDCLDSLAGEGDLPKSTLVSRNITVLGHRTSVRLEPEMWAALSDIARRERTSIHNLCSLVQLKKVKESSLTAAIRVFLLLYYRAAATEEGHLRARHGNFDVMKARVQVSDSMLRQRA